MDLIVATPQGEAEVSVTAIHESVTLADLLARVLPSTPPTIVYVDGRAVPIGTLVSAAGLLTGSVIDIVGPPDPTAEADIALVQVAGEGAGNRRALAPGRYTVGTARRANVSPLSFNEVLVPRCDLVVEHGGSVVVSAEQGDLDGRRVGDPTPWAGQLLRIGHRVFRLDAPIDDRAISLTPTASGLINFVPQPRSQAAAEIPTTGRPRQVGRRSRNRRTARGEAAVPQSLVDVAGPVAELDGMLEQARRSHLDLAEVVRRAMQLSSSLWERRSTDDDAFRFSVGLADQPWNPRSTPQPTRPEVSSLPSTPVVVDLANQRGVGFAGVPAQARAAARALIMQACVAHSPIDLDIVVLSTPTGAARWEWVKWLPHSRGSSGVQLLHDEEAIRDWITAQRTLTTVVASIQSLGRPIAQSRLTLAVLDNPALWRGRTAMLRGVFAEAQLPVRFVALADRADDIPAVCTTVVRIEANGGAEVDYPITHTTITDVIPFVLDHDVAAAAARKLSPLLDSGAESPITIALPPVVSLGTIIDPDGLDAGRIAEHWKTEGRSRRPRLTVGVGESGPVTLDLAQDGPHVVIVGATRAGKTELLRSMIASLVAGYDPDALNVICVEPTDGASFGAFAGQPHMAGAVTDLSERRGLRLLRALRAEASRRVRLLADQNVADCEAYQAACHLPPMPRLIIAIDDATDVMVKAPDFLPSLIELIDHSPNLGFHLLVATEQLTRAVEHSLKTLAAIRIGLRMTDPVAAAALMGNRDCAQISLHAPGRGAVRIGVQPSLAVQFASASAASTDLMEINPFIVARDLNSAERRMIVRAGDGAPDTSGRSGLTAIIETVGEAASTCGYAPTRPIVCSELPAGVTFEHISSLPTASTQGVGAGFALSDLPEDRGHGVRRWNPAADGNVFVVGGSSLERSEVLTTLIVAACQRYPSDRFHGFVIDASMGPLGHRDSLARLEALPNIGAVVSTDDLDRVARLLLHLDAELSHRRASDASVSDLRMTLFVNDVGALLRDLESVGDVEHGRELLDRVISNGPTFGVTTVMTAAAETVVPPRLLSQFRERIVLHLDDRSAYRALGIDPARVPPQQRGRALTLPDHVEIQIATVGDPDAAIADLTAQPAVADQGPPIIARTPSSVAVAETIAATAHDSEGWRLPVGLDARSLRPAELALANRGGALIIGEGGTGKSTLLANLARCALNLDALVDIHAVAATWSPLLLLPGLTSATTSAGIDRWAAEFFAELDRPKLVLVDDADRLEGAVFERLVELTHPNLAVIVAGRTRALEAESHWTAPLRRLAKGVILRPARGDGAILGVHLLVGPAQLNRGRGVMIDNESITPIIIADPAHDDSGTSP